MSTVEIPKLEYAFSVRIEFKERLRFAPTTPMGGRVYVPVTGGTVAGRGCRAV